MEIHQDFHRARQAISDRLLKAHIRRGPLARLTANTVEALVANAPYNAHAVGIGYKTIDGQQTDQPCIRVHVVQKIANELLPPQHVIPKFIDGIPVDVVESPPAYILAAQPSSINPRKEHRPIQGGLSAAQFEVTAGTLSCICRSVHVADDPKKRYALSNNHVFANLNKAEIGDEIYQQSPLDGGGSSQTIANLTRFVPLNLDGKQPNTVDCAIAEIGPDVTSDPSVCDVGAVSGSTEATLSMDICKFGRTTGYTEGVVTDLALDVTVGMDHNDASKIGVFKNQMRIDATKPYGAIGLGGDSGSLIMQRKGGKAVGLYFAGPSSGSYGLANHIDEVLSELEIELV